LKSNHHTHSFFSDGKAHPEEFAKKAVESGFAMLGFSEHSPVSFENAFSFKSSSKEEYLAIINSLKAEYSGRLEVALSMEMEYIPGISDNFAAVEKEYGLDYVIGSVHLVRNGTDEALWFIDGSLSETYDDGLRLLFGNDIKKAVSAYWHQVNRMLETQRTDIIGHLDKIKMHNHDRFFREDEPWYVALVNETLDLIKSKEVIIEVNTRGIYKNRSATTYPGPGILKQVKALGIPVMVNSDAHQPHELDGAFAFAEQLLRDTGIKTVRCFQAGCWIEVPV
jgi:histidinol-phosphatase (PHP family)